MKHLQKMISVLLAAVLLVGTAPLAGFVGLELTTIGFTDVFSPRANAATSGYYTYSVWNDEAMITDVDPSISGKIIIPSELGGYPVTQIGMNAFKNCTSLSEITIPDSVRHIEYDAFYNCTSLTGVYISDIASWCNIDFDNSLSNPLYYTRKLYLNGTLVTELEIPNTVTSIGDYVFYYCSSLTAITLSDSVTSIGKYAFYWCYSLGEIIIENTNCKIYDSDNTIYSHAVIRGHDGSTAQAYSEKYERAFVLVDGLNNDVIISGSCGDNVNYSLSYDGMLNIIGAGDMYLYDQPTAVPWYKYRGVVRSVYISDGITNIGQYLFFEFSNMSTITIPDSVTKIGCYAFCCCNSLIAITIPKSMTSIDKFAFYYCTALIEITIPDTVTSIGISAFADCDSLTKITILNPDCKIYDSEGTIDSGATIIGYDNSTAKIYADKYYRIFNAIPCKHETIEIIPVLPATCTATGLTDGTCCKLCKTVLRKQEITPMLGHSYDREFTILPTHTQEGIFTYTCVNCEDSYTQTINKLPNHTHNPITVEPTCNGEGYTIYMCVCGDNYSADFVPALGHVWGNGEITRFPTETEDGEITFICTVCGEKRTEVFVESSSFTDSENLVRRDDNIIGIAGVAVTELLTQAGNGASVSDNAGNALAAETKIGTGAVLTLPDGTCFTVVVQGDIDGDGEISAADARSILRFSVGLDDFNDAQKLAADLDENGVTSSDARLALRASVGLDNPAEWFEKIR